MSRRILVVDDERGVRAALGQLLEYEGYEVRTAENAVDAIAEYERFRPQTPDGAFDPNGVVQWIIGVGGKSRGGLAGASARLPNSQKATSQTFGVLELTLHSGSYEWRFLAEGSSSFSDTGSASCH